MPADIYKRTSKQTTVTKVNNKLSNKQTHTQSITSWKQFVDNLPKWEHDMLIDIEDQDPTFESRLADILKDLNDLIIAVSDGRYDPETITGSFGWLSGTQDEILWQGLGPVSGQRT